MTEPTRQHRPVLLFDGVCNLCHGAVRWVIKHDSKGQFSFASLQSQAGKDALTDAGCTGPLPDSVVLIAGERLLTESEAAIAVAGRLGMPWSLMKLALLITRRLRDGLYRWVARNRYRWFGRQHACLIPTPELRSRFLDAGEFPVAGSSASPRAVDSTPTGS